MLDEYKELYLKQIRDIGDWKNLNKNQLCFKYIENEKNGRLKDSYLSAIIVKYLVLSLLTPLGTYNVPLNLEYFMLHKYSRFIFVK